jgi:uncharacterized protein (UPF0128 family)
VRTTKQTYNLEQELREEGENFKLQTTNPTNILLKEVIEQLKLANSTLEEIHDELHELTNRGSY